MEKDLAKQIRQLIEKDKHGVVEISISTFAKMWGNDTIYKLMQFTESNGLGYVSILQGNRILAVRFWKIKGTELLEEPNELQN